MATASQALGVKYASLHVDPQGPGDKRPTARQIVEDEDLLNKLTDKVALITGCSSGIGVETARALYTAGVRLFLTVRDLQKGQEVVKDIQASCKSGQGSVELLELHLDSLQSVRQCADTFLHQQQQLNILILNAASSSPAFQSRVVAVSSSGHQISGVQFDDLNLQKQGYNKWTAYGQSKTANIYMANEIERRFASEGLHANSIHPGGILTPLARHMAEADLKAFETPDKQRRFKSPEQGAATTVWAAVSKDWEGKGGKYLEDCKVAEEKKSEDEWGGVAPHAYDVEAAKRLWDVSMQLVGLQP